MPDCGAGVDVIERVGRRLERRIPLAHLVGAALAATSGALTSSGAGGPGFGGSDLIALLGYLAVAAPLGIWTGHLIVKRATAWMADGRAPAQAEVAAVVRLPWRLALQGAVGWLGAALLWSFLSSMTHDAAYTARVAMSILLGGIATSGLVYLIVEWSIRPLVAAAMSSRVPEQRLAPGVWTKLLFSWAIGADVFLLMIGLTFVGRPASHPPSAAAIWFIIGAGLVAGTLVVHVATRSLAAPLLELRRSVGRVQRGDLDVRLTVNDGSELGLLQAGFNEMVGGLRERAVLSDLFGRQVGEEVARRAVAAGDVVLGGERRDVGVVFVDLIASTGLAQSRSPEDVVSLLNQLFAAIVRVIGEEGGWVNKFEGDGALCIFGAPAPADDYAARALRAARTLRSELLALAATHPELDAAIGVSAGRVVAGNVGAQERFEYTVIGSPVNEAARLTDEAKLRLGRVLASEEAVARGGEEAASWAVSGERVLRGYSTPTLIYEPTDLATSRLTAAT